MKMKEDFITRNDKYDISLRTKYKYVKNFKIHGSLIVKKNT
jgi:hypothetical protein